MIAIEAAEYRKFLFRENHALTFTTHFDAAEERQSKELILQEVLFLKLEPGNEWKATEIARKYQAPPSSS